ncbi:MAG: hypothetical protein F4X69_15845 [Gemmatimonadetes bacterium]|nr:hypothetical protein [Gemmatimonadota bacterium]
MPDLELFPSPVLTITYHPIVPDSASAEGETAWLETIVEDRRGFQERIDRMLPVGHSFDNFAPFQTMKVGDPIYVSPLAPSCDDVEKHGDVTLRALNALQAKVSAPWFYANGNGWPTRVIFRVGVISPKTQEAYCSDDYGWSGTAGRGFVGRPFSVFKYESPYDFFSQEYTGALEHELGHNLGLIHTNEDPQFPMDGGVINADGYLVRRIGWRGNEIHVMHMGEAQDFMQVGIGRGRSDERWVSAYSWDKMVRFLRKDGPMNSNARVNTHATWVCTH